MNGWGRIQCDVVTGNVESLHLRGSSEDEFLLQNFYLVGNEVSSSLADLRYLKYLDMSRNVFKGSRIPKFIGSLKQLTYLNLSHTGFEGIVPHHIGNLSNLEVLDLSSNYELMANDMTWTFSHLSSLKHLDLSFLKLSGAKHRDMVLYMPFLKTLCLHASNLYLSDLDHSLNSSKILPNIKHLELGSFVNFQVPLPRFLKNMTSVTIMRNLIELDLSENMFKQIEHVGIWRQCQLKKLSVSFNHFILEMIDLLKNASECSGYSLKRLSLDYSLYGRIPESLGRLDNLRELDLSSCG
ncbi:unnamed protein product [Lactuca saligna]|uniref:Uncharacterized protein n=1 Tax=Lactuca saligna TaxID=75948 RepID=A0AA36DZJ8_LACSI|nr:unnamed protein product [Lactuca saligna]